MSGATIILVMSLLLVLMWIARSYTPENWIGIAALLLVISTKPISALSFYSGRTSTLLLHFGKTKIVGILRNMANRSYAILNDHTNGGRELKTKVSFGAYSSVRLLLFIAFTLVQFVLLIVIGLSLFFVPIIYFSANESNVITYTFFASAYIISIVILIILWNKKIQHLEAPKNAQQA